VSPSASRKKRSVWLLCLGLMLIILAAGCATKFEQPKSFRMRIRAFAEDGGPTHSVSVTVGLNPDGGN
jgi:hypothetical protein